MARWDVPQQSKKGRNIGGNLNPNKNYGSWGSALHILQFVSCTHTSENSCNGRPEQISWPRAHSQDISPANWMPLNPTLPKNALFFSDSPFCLGFLSPAYVRAQFSRKCVGNVSEMCRKCVGNVSEMRRKCAGNVSEICRKCVGNTSQLCLHQKTVAGGHFRFDRANSVFKWHFSGCAP